MAHRIVNGQQVELTPEEAQQLIDEWGANVIKNEAERPKREAREKRERRKSKLDEAVAEIMSWGITETQIENFMDNSRNARDRYIAGSNNIITALNNPAFLPIATNPWFTLERRTALITILTD